MIKLETGQCGLCAHFGEVGGADDHLVQIRIHGEAPDGTREDCGHPQHAGLNLRVSADSGCDGFTPAAA